MTDGEHSKTYKLVESSCIPETNITVSTILQLEKKKKKNEKKVMLPNGKVASS